MYFGNKNSQHNEFLAFVPDFKKMADRGVFEILPSEKNGEILIKSSFSNWDMKIDNPKSRHGQVNAYAVFLFNEKELLMSFKIEDFRPIYKFGQEHLPEEFGKQVLPFIEKRLKEVDEHFYQLGEYDELWTKEQIKTIAKEQLKKINQPVSLIARELEDVITLECLGAALKELCPFMYECLTHDFREGDFYVCNQEEQSTVFSRDVDYLYHGHYDIVGQGLIFTDFAQLAIQQDGNEIKIIKAQQADEIVNVLKKEVTETVDREVKRKNRATKNLDKH